MLVTELCSDIQHAYDRREESLGEEVARELERRVVLSVLDRKWREHLYEMDYLQEGIGLRAMAQRDPLVEYQREGFLLFQAMTEAIKEESVGYLFQLEVETQAEAPAEEAEAAPRAASANGSSGSDGASGRGRAQAGVRRQGPGRRREAPAALQYSAPTVDGDSTVEVREEAPASEPSRRATRSRAPRSTRRARAARARRGGRGGEGERRRWRGGGTSAATARRRGRTSTLTADAGSSRALSRSAGRSSASDRPGPPAEGRPRGPGRRR